MAWPHSSPTPTHHLAPLVDFTVPLDALEGRPRTLFVARQLGPRQIALVAAELHLLVAVVVTLLQPARELARDVSALLLKQPQRKV